MTRKMILMFIAELAAVALLRAIYMLRRDKAHLPRANKVGSINRTPVFRQHSESRKPLEDRIRDVEIQGWTPPWQTGKIRNTPDDPPDA